MKLWQMRKERRACQRFERHIESLGLALARGEARFYLDLRVELLEALVEQTGGSELTERYRSRLAVSKAKVALQPPVRMVRAS
jgi:hypothetical protein